MDKVQELEKPKVKRLNLDELLAASPIELDIDLSSGVCTTITIQAEDKASAMVHALTVGKYLAEVHRFHWKLKKDLHRIGLRFLCGDTGELYEIAGDGTGLEFDIASLPELVAYFGKERIEVTQVVEK